MTLLHTEWKESVCDSREKRQAVAPDFINTQCSHTATAAEAAAVKVATAAAKQLTNHWAIDSGKKKIYLNCKQKAAENRRDKRYKMKT